MNGFKYGDVVEYDNSEDGLRVTGTVVDVGASGRLVIIAPDDELDNVTRDYTQVRPVSEIDSLKDSRDDWMAQAISNKERADKAESRVAELQAQIDAFPYETGAPVGDKVAARIAEYRERAEKAEADRDYWKTMYETSRDDSANLGDELRKIRDLLANEPNNAAPLASDLVRNLIAERDQLRFELRESEIQERHDTDRRDAAEARHERELAAALTNVIHWQSLYRQMAQDRDQLKRYVDSQKATHNPQDNQVPQAVRDNDDDWWELNHDTGMYECGRYSYALTDIATVFGIKERIY